MAQEPRYDPQPLDWDRTLWGIRDRRMGDWCRLPSPQTGKLERLEFAGIFAAYQWLGLCMERGLSMEAGYMTIKVWQPDRRGKYRLVKDIKTYGENPGPMPGA